MYVPTMFSVVGNKINEEEIPGTSYSCELIDDLASRTHLMWLSAIKTHLTLFLVQQGF